MKNALILFGGVSSEHDVSVVSARSVIENTPRDKYNIILIGITKDGRWFKYDGDVAKLPDDKWLEDKNHSRKQLFRLTARITESLFLMMTESKNTY